MHEKPISLVCKRMATLPSLHGQLASQPQPPHLHSHHSNKVGISVLLLQCYWQDLVLQSLHRWQLLCPRSLRPCSLLPIRHQVWLLRVQLCLRPVPCLQQYPWPHLRQCRRPLLTRPLLQLWLLRSPLLPVYLSNSHLLVQWPLRAFNSK